MPKKHQNLPLTSAIQTIIDSAKESEELSKNRIASYGSFIKIIETYQVNTKRTFYVKNVNKEFVNNFLKYLLDEKKYSNGYALKKIADLKTVCLSSELEGFEINSELKTYKALKEKKQHLIYLNPTELEIIKNTPIADSELQNARKWLLIGCNIGQRAGDLLNLNEDNFIIKNGLEVIQLTQEKTGKEITIPNQTTIKEIIADGFPIKIPIQKLNDQIKEICQLCKFDVIISGVLFDEDTKRRAEGNYKKYKLITSHVCRRTFAMNNYGKMPTSLLKKITGHTTDAILLDYIGKNLSLKEQQTFSLF